MVNEAGLSRLLQRISGKEFGIASAYRGGNTRKENQRRKGILLTQLNSAKMGGYVLIGHWQEAPDGIDYQDAAPDQLSDTVEESVLYIKPDEMSDQEFIQFNVDIANKFNQDAVIVGLDGIDEAISDMGVYLYYKDGSRDKIGNRVTLGKISQAYSQMKHKPNVPFVFEGTLHPTNNIGKQVFKVRNILYAR